MAFNMDGYVPVESRIEAFYAAHPDGSIQTEITHLDERLVIVKATAYRTADDIRPTTGHSMITIPGKTPFTKDSEVENAETSAVGRALAMMGFEVRKGMASAQEVRNKTLPDPQIDVPEWVAPFNAARKERGITAQELAEVLGMSGTITNIEKWMAEDPIRTPDKLLSLAADLKAVPV
jgi:hypothetical protein